MVVTVMRLPFVLVDHREGNLAFAGDLIANLGGGLQFADRTFNFEKLNFEIEAVAWSNLGAKPEAVNAGKYAQFASPLLFHEQSDATELGQCLDHEDARHNRHEREVTFKKLLVGGEILISFRAHTWLNRSHPVYEQERIAVRNQRFDSVDIHDVDGSCHYKTS